jgi:hypothetical protein
MIKRLYKKSAFVVVLVALASAFFDWRHMPLSILLGGVLAVANLKGLSWGVEGLVGSPGAAAKLVFFSLFRLLMLFIIIVALAFLGLIKLFGLLIGFTIVFTLLLIEGLKESKDL